MTGKKRKAKAVMAEIAAERARQISKEGWMPEHDDGHDAGELALAAACYATPILLYKRENYANQITFNDPWPWSEGDDRRPGEGNVVASNGSLTPKKRRRQLVKAAALIVAEIERLDRVRIEEI